MPDRSLPSVAIVMPVLDEAAVIDETLASVAAQDYEGPMRVVLADGGSTDGTRERLDEWCERQDGWQVMHNPDRKQSPGINRAVAMADAEVIVRLDAHTVYAPDYVRRSVEALAGSDAVVVGGPMRPRAESGFAAAVALAMSSPVTTGPGRFHREGARGRVDTVYLGAFRREDFLEVGGLRSFPSGAGEDADIHHRWRRTGRWILLDPNIRSEYRPRRTLRSLLRQHVKYGQAKAELLWVNGAWPSWRPLAPALLVPAIVLVVALAVTGGPVVPAIGLFTAWIATLALAAMRSPGRLLQVVAAGAAMHLGYGVGLWWGMLRGPRRVRRAVRVVSTAGVGGVVPATGEATGDPHGNPQGGEDDE